MTAAKNQHFVPQFYFRPFSADGKSICVLQRSKGTTHSKASIGGQASKTNFYGTDGTEEKLSKVESLTAGVLHRLIEGRCVHELDATDRERLLRWLVLQRYRTKAWRDASAPLIKPMVEFSFDYAIKHDLDLSEEEKSKLLDALSKVDIRPDAFQVFEMAMADQRWSSINDLDATVLLNRTEHPFCFGDAPVVFYNALYRRLGRQGGLGLVTPGLMIYYPLTPTRSLLLTDPDRYQFNQVNDGVVEVLSEDVHALNSLELHASSSCLYFGNDAHADYFKGLWAEARDSLSSHASIILNAPESSVEKGFPFDFYQPQLPFDLRLSFLDPRRFTGNEIEGTRPTRQRAIE